VCVGSVCVDGDGRRRVDVDSRSSVALKKSVSTPIFQFKVFQGVEIGVDVRIWEIQQPWPARRSES
jgi:hypothetical protein